MAHERVATTQRISLMVPDALYQELERIAMSRYGGTVPELVRSFIRLGMLVMHETEGGKYGLVVKSAEDGHERELFLL